MTGPYPPSSAEGHDAPSAADLSYADVAAPPSEQSPAPLPSGPEAPAQPSDAARVYSWPSAPPAVPSEVDPSAAESDVDHADADLSTVDQEVVSEDDTAELEPSMVDEVAIDDLAPATPNQPAPQGEAEPEPTDPAVARMRAVQGRLGELDDLPIEEHPARYEELHSELTGALAQIDRAPDSQA